MYQDRAVVTRTARDMALEPGAVTLRFEDLPPSLIPGSVRASGSGTADAVILGVDTRSTHLGKRQTALVDSLEARLRNLEGEKAALLGQKAALEVRQDFLKSIKGAYSEKVAPQILAGTARAVDLKQMADFLRTEYAQGELDRAQAERKLADLEDAIKRTRGDLEGARGRAAQVTWTAALELEVRRTGRLDLSLAYAVTRVGWTPSYDVHASDDLQHLEVTYYGVVAQTTGEDWADADLTLSTALPSVGAQVPELAAWTLSLQEPRVMRDMGLANPEAAMRVAEAPPPPLEMAGAGVVAGGISASFPIERPQTIPSDGTAKRLLITSLRLTGAFSFTTVPKVSPYAFVTAATRNDSDFPLLSGDSRVFLGTQYVGNGAVENVAPREEFTLSLGADTRIKVTRDLVKKERAGGGKSETERVTYLYRTRVENHRDVPIAITVLDQLPVSQDWRIRIGDLRLEPEPRSRDPQQIITWAEEIPVGTAREFLLGFSVEYPTGVRVGGLF